MLKESAMEFNCVNEFGPIYSEINSESIFCEPRYIEIYGDDLYLVVDKKNHDNKDYGYQCFGKPLVMDASGKAFRYGIELTEICWENNLSFVINNRKYCFQYDTEVEPASIQLLDNDLLLLSLSKRQIVVMINSTGQKIWEFGVEYNPGVGRKLCVPMFAIKSSLNNVLISDTLNSRVIEVNQDGKIIWEYGTACEHGSDYNHLWYPMCAKISVLNHIFICDSLNNRVLKVNRNREVIIQEGNAIVEQHQLCYPRSTQMISDNQIIIANTHKSNIFVIDANSFKVTRIIDNVSLEFAWPRCVKFDEKERVIYIADGLNSRILVVDYDSLTLQSTIESNQEYTLKDPHDIDISPNGELLITNADGNQIIEISKCGKLIRTWDDNIDDPHSARYIENGLIITNTGKAEIIIEQDCIAERISRFYSISQECYDVLNRPRFAFFYKKNHILVLDTGNHRIVKLLKRDGRWVGADVNICFKSNTLHSLNYPRWITRIGSNSFLVTDTENNRIVQLEHYENDWV